MFNQFTGVGNLAADPESRFTQSGTQVVNFTVCCDSGYGDKKRTEFVKVVAWDKLAKVCTDFLRKGSKCLIQGEMATRQWEDKDGNKRYTTEIVAREMKMLTPKGGGGGSQPPSGDGDDQPYMGQDVPF